MDNLLLDLQYAFRGMRRNVSFTAFAILIVGLGIGASCTVFGLVNAVLLRPLPFREPDRLVWISNHDSSGLSSQTTQVGHLLDLREQNRSFQDLAAYFAFYGVGDNLVSGQGEPERLSGVSVSQNFFGLLGVSPQIGRTFTAEESRFNGRAAVLLGHGVWQRRFASDPAIVGHTLTINDKPFIVVGVMPASFDFASVFAPGSHIDLYFPFPLSAETNRWGNTLAIIGRLKPSVSVKQAAAELKILAARITKAHPERNTFEGFVTPLRERVSGRLRLPLMVLASAVGVVMLIVCANLSNLLLARMAVRRKEVSIRAALGADRIRLIRQLLTESVALSCCGAALGIALAFGATWLLAHVDAMGIPLLASVHTDLRALTFTVLAAAATGVMFGLAPALQACGGVAPAALNDSARGSTAGRGRDSLRSALVVAEIAFACVLLIGAGLFIRSFLHLLDVNLGFQPERALAVRVDPDRRVAAKDQPAYFSEVVKRAMSVPGVEAAGLSDALPLGRNRSWGTAVKGRTYPKGDAPDAFVRVVSPGYIAAMGIPLLEGRDFDERDGPESYRVMLINKTMARLLFPGESAVGKEIRTCGPGYGRIVGVVGDVRHLALEQEAGMEMYMNIRQCRDFASVDLVLRSRRTPAELAPAIRAALRPIVPNLPGSDFRALRMLVDKAVSPRRFVVSLLGGFAGFALVLASLGIYAVVSYAVSQRTQEIGIRMALGASGTQLQASIVGRMLLLATMGMLLGAAASWITARILAGLLFGITPTDPLTFGGMLAILTVVALAASYFPARRASLVEPAAALRTA